MGLNDPKCLDRQVLANSVDPDQTAAPGGAVWSGSTLFASLFASGTALFAILPASSGPVTPQ